MLQVNTYHVYNYISRCTTANVYQSLLSADICNCGFTMLRGHIGITSVAEKLETLHHLLDQLPELNHTVFERIIFHLAR